MVTQARARTPMLPERRRWFVERYMGEARGNATKAARLAGYKSPAVEGSRLLRNAEVREAIDERTQADPAVKDREHLQRWWSAVVDDVSADLGQRLRASELLAKSQGAFVVIAKAGSPADAASDDELEAELRRRGFIDVRKLNDIPGLLNPAALQEYLRNGRGGIGDDD